MVARLGFESARTADPLAWVDVSDRLRGFEIAVAARTSWNCWTRAHAQ